MKAHRVSRRTVLAALAAYPAASIVGQTTLDSYQVDIPHPRLLLRSQRLRLLRRERERQSPRWRQFELLIKGKAQMPEPGFAYALYYQVSGDEAIGRQAVEWATRGEDVRQLALVLDWCEPLFSGPAKEAILSKLTRALQSAPPADVSAARSRIFAAIALTDHVKANTPETLQRVVEQWWRGRVAPGLRQGATLLSRSEEYPLFEILHVIRDNLKIELQDDALPYFRDLAANQLLSYYPAAYPAPENEYHIPYMAKNAQPDLRLAAMTRVAELSFVAYESNAKETQFLQGWLSHDRFELRSPLGAPYEFLWANPYQPGLSFYHMPLHFHDARAGRLFLRSSWDEDATWLSYVQGQLQLFRDGKIEMMKPKQAVIIGHAAVLPASSTSRLQVDPDGPHDWFIVGFHPGAVCDIEVDDEELAEAKADAGGILALRFTRADKFEVRLRERPHT
jgi:hypothetical protein